MIITYHHVPIKFNEQAVTRYADQAGQRNAKVIGHGQDWNTYKLTWDTDHEIDFEHPDHVELEDYDHYHQVWQKPPVDCYLCHDTITKINHWLLVTPIKVLHPVCQACGQHLIDVRQLKLAENYTLKDFGFPFKHLPDSYQYLIDQSQIAKCEQCQRFFPAKEQSKRCFTCRSKEKEA